MGIAPHPGPARAGASFELDRLDLVDGCLVVRGWWFGVRGVRFVRPALVVAGRQVLATLEHKPWVAAEDGSWVAAFPWKRRLDVAGVTLVVAPSVEVPLDRDAEPPAIPVRSAPAPVLERAGEPGRVPAAPGTVVEEVRPRLRDELDGVERRLDAMHAELRDARAAAAAREARCRELEGVAARERRAARDAEAADDEFVRAHAMAVLDRDRAMAQHEEAVNDREAAVRARKRMEAQRDEALAARTTAEARRDEALAERDEARRQRDELLLAHQALQAQLKAALAERERSESQDLGADIEPPPADPSAAPTRPSAVRAAAERTRQSIAGGGAGRTHPSAAKVEPDGEQPIGVRTIPAARTVAASLHRSQREREHGVTPFDLWAIRILGSVAALSFISLLVMILKAFFVF